MARHLITTAEQLFKTSDGHWSKLALLIHRDHSFRKRIACLNIDEAHTVFFAGLSRYGIPAFRSAWGRFGDLRISLPKTVLIHVFTATSPPHVQKVIEDRVCFGLLGSGFFRGFARAGRFDIVDFIVLIEGGSIGGS